MRTKTILIFLILLSLIPVVSAQTRNPINSMIEANTTDTVQLGVLTANSTVVLNLAPAEGQMITVNVYIGQIGGPEVYSNNNWAGNQTVSFKIAQQTLHVLAIYNLQTYFITVTGWYEVQTSTSTTATSATSTTTTTTTTRPTQSMIFLIDFDFAKVYMLVAYSALTVFALYWVTKIFQTLYGILRRVTFSKDGDKK